MKKKLFFSLILSSLLLVRCAATDKKSEVASLKQASAKVALIDDGTSANLTKEDVLERKKLIANVKYDLSVNLSEEKDTFQGTMNITFNLTSAVKDLRIDFYEGKVLTIEVNKGSVGLEAKKNYWINLPKEKLKKGLNTVKITYQQKYSSTGDGLHRFQDPEDHQYYLHTQFETYDANKFMPCFDQPDLRAQFTLNVIAPENWKVVTSVPESSINRLDNKKNQWIFPVSREISTYIFSLHAGPYKIFQDQYVRANKKTINLRLFVRPSLEKYVDADFWFKITKQGLGFYENYFGAKYPFDSKYDQLIVPEFNAGGMENAAAVTYSERFVSRSATTRSQRRNLASVMLHEMAHMWFGDLVTMAWWNDLWLNESFATYMSTVAMAEATEFKEAWQEFSAGTKMGAYVQDAMVTSHPIEGDVSSVKDAFGTFDGITYNKGASVLRQLGFYMTEASFKQGVQSYFKKYAYKNTELKNFIDALQTKTSKNLHVWADRWLKQSNTDLLTTSWSCDGKYLNAIKLQITPYENKLFRPQSLEVALLNNTPNNSAIVAFQKIRVDFQNEKPVVLKGHWACPGFIYPNNNDYGYINLDFSTENISFLEKNLNQISDKQTRAMLWNNLWRMVRDTKISLKQFVDIVNANLVTEDDEVIKKQVFRTFSTLLYYWPKNTDQQIQARSEFVKKFENYFLQQIQKSTSGSEDEKIWFSHFSEIAESKEGLNQLYAYFKSGKVSEKFLLDSDSSWDIAIKLNRYQYPKASEVVSIMTAKDKSDRGQKNALAASAIKPDVENKKRWIHEIIENSNQYSLQQSWSVMSYLFTEEQNNLKMKFKDNFYEYFNKNKAAEDESRVNPVVFGLLPLTCDLTNTKTLQTALRSRDRINPSLSKRLRETIDEDIRCQKIREKSLL